VSPTTPLFVAFEGIDGCGKSTHAKRVAQAVEARFTFEPGDTPLGAVLRQRLLDASEPMSPQTEALLMLADRSHHVSTVITPTLASGQSVVSDRFFGSTLAYQGYGREMDLAPLRAATDVAIGTCRPDLTIVIDIPVAVAHARRAPSQRDRFESATVDFHERVRQGFLSLAEQEPNWIVINGNHTLDTVTDRVDAALTAIGWFA
jgi:dTMP kinase